MQDLAGILDPQIIERWKAGTLKQYLKERHVAYAYLPEPKTGAGTIYQAVHEALTLTPVKEAPKQNMTGFELYKTGN